MGAFPFAALIPMTAIICTFIFLLRVAQLKHDRRSHDHTGEIDALRDQVKGLETGLERLEARVRVLERIVTDDKTKLRDEIDRLRA